MEATANLIVAPAGLHLRLSHRGYTYDSLHTPAVEGEQGTDTAARLLDTHGWQVTEPWQQERTGGRCAAWTALINAKEQ